MRRDALDRPGAWQPFLDVADSPHPWTATVAGAESIHFDSGGHRLTVDTTLVDNESGQGPKAHRVWALSYDRADDPFGDGRGLFYMGTSADIARNNLLSAMEMVTGDTVAAMDGPDESGAHYLVHKTLDRPDTRFPCSYLAEKAADHFSRRGLDADDGPYRVFVCPPDEYERIGDRLRGESA